MCTTETPKADKTICRYCGGEAQKVATFNLPIPNKYFPTYEEARAAERRPHELAGCETCGSYSLMNVPFTAEELFSGQYAFTPVSSSWRNHCVELARSIKDRVVRDGGYVYDIGGNDGLLASILYRIIGGPVLVVDPSDVKTIQEGTHWPKRKGFFGEEFARQLLVNGDSRADVITATNVLAHVPDPLDFMRGVKILLAANGLAIFEFPDGGIFADGILFDTLYAEHMGYITMHGIVALTERAGLAVSDIQFPDVHGGSLRVFIRHSAPGKWAHAEHRQEKAFMPETALKLLNLASRLKGKKIIGFGSAAKSVVVNSLFADDSDAVPRFIIDETPAKIGKFQPGSGAKILPLPTDYHEALSPEGKLANELLREAEICINYAWNYRDEVREKLAKAGFKGEIVTVHD